MNRKRLVALAAVLAFALVIGTVAVVAGRGGSSSDAALPKLQFAGSRTSAAADSGGAAPSAMLAPASPITYEVGGTLPTLDGTAPAYSVRPDATTARVTQLAAALGVPHERVLVQPTAKAVAQPPGPQLVVFGGAWSLVRLADGCSVSSSGITECVSTGSAVSSGAAGAATPTQSAPSAGSPDCPMPPCPAGQACAQVCPDTGAPGTAPVRPPPPAPPVRPADLPSRADAEKIGRSVLEKAGVDLASADVRVDDAFSLWIVTATPRIGGMPAIGLETSVQVGPSGAIVGGYGWLVKLDKIGDYPLAGTAAGLERLRSGRFAGPVPMMAADATAQAGVAFTEPAGASGSVSGSATVVAPSEPAPDGKQPLIPPGRPESVPLAEQKVAITGVHLALARSFRSGSSETLAPVYVFETEAGFTVPPVPAVVDALLEPAPEPQPSPSPVPKPLPAPPAVSAEPPAATGGANQSSPGAAPAQP